MKQQLISSLSKYLIGKKYNKIRTFTEANLVADEKDDLEKFKFDISAERNGTKFFYTFVEPTYKNITEIVNYCQQFENQFRNNSSAKLKLLVKTHQSDLLIQKLNSRQLEHIGIIRVQSAKQSV